MVQIRNVAALSSRLGVVVPLLLLCGCPAAKQQANVPDTPERSAKQAEGPAAKPTDMKGPASAGSSALDGPPQKVKAEPQVASEDPASASIPSNSQEIPTNLGEPLVDVPGDLLRLDKASPVWIDKSRKQVVLIGTACKADYPLEFFATYPDRGYESVVVVFTQPSVVHAALLALGAKVGKPVQFQPTYVPPTGTEVEIDVCWKDKDGKRQQTPAQQLVRDIKTKQPLDVNWVFAGSMFWEDEATGTKSYLADRGDFITVLNVPTALLDVPIESASALGSRLFEGFTERLPPPGTPVTLILKPKLDRAEK